MSGFSSTVSENKKPILIGVGVLVTVIVIAIVGVLIWNNGSISGSGREEYIKPSVNHLTCIDTVPGPYQKVADVTIEGPASLFKHSANNSDEYYVELGNKYYKLPTLPVNLKAYNFGDDKYEATYGNSTNTTTTSYESRLLIANVKSCNVASNSSTENIDLVFAKRQESEQILNILPSKDDFVVVTKSPGKNDYNTKLFKYYNNGSVAERRRLHEISNVDVRAIKLVEDLDASKGYVYAVHDHTKHQNSLRVMNGSFVVIYETNYGVDAKNDMISNSNDLVKFFSCRTDLKKTITCSFNNGNEVVQKVFDAENNVSDIASLNVTSGALRVAYSTKNPQTNNTDVYAKLIDKSGQLVEKEARELEKNLKDFKNVQLFNNDGRTFAVILSGNDTKIYALPDPVDQATTTTQAPTPSPTNSSTASPPASITPAPEKNDSLSTAGPTTASPVTPATNATGAPTPVASTEAPTTVSPAPAAPSTNATGAPSTVSPTTAAPSANGTTVKA